MLVAGLENFTVTELYYAERTSVEPFSKPLAADQLLFACGQIANLVDQVWLTAHWSASF